MVLENSPLYEKLADRIHRLIRTGTLRPGDQVPSVRRLSKQQGVSVSTVLQAYRSLEDRGVIEARPQSGYYVLRPPAVVAEPASSRPPRRALTPDVHELADAVFGYANQPDVVAFGSGCPSGELFPLERLRRALSSVARRDRTALGRYGLPPGTERFRRAVARRALEWGCRFDFRNLITTTGCTEAINLGLRAVTKPGDLVALESPNSFLQILHALGLRAIEIPTHPRSGISLEALEQAFVGHPVKAALVMPNVSNPIGASMSDFAKKQLVELAAARNIPLIEDNIYADLHFDSPVPRAAKSFDRADNVMLVGSFSKTVAPGLKVGWIHPGRWRDRVRMLKFATSGSQSELFELAVAELLSSGGYVRALRQLRRCFESQVDLARGVIAESFPSGTRVTRPSGAYMLWVEMPKACDSVTLFEALMERGITIAPGPMFSASQGYRNCMRLSLGQVWSERHERALREIGRLAREMSRDVAVKA